MSVSPPVGYGAKPLPLNNFPVLSCLQDAYSVTLLRVNATEVPQSGNKEEVAPVPLEGQK